MAGKIIADIIESAGSQISLNVGNVTILTASSSGLTLTPTNNVNINVTNSNVTFTTANITTANITTATVTTANITGVATFSTGTAALPSITTAGDPDTGIYFPSANTIGFTRGGIEVGRFDSNSANANFQFNSGFGSVATAYAARAWVNFNGTGTVAIRASGNVSSITDNSTGNYTINFTTAMPDVNYSVSGYCVNPSSRALVFGDVNTYATGSLRINSAYISGTNGEATSVDATYVNISIFR